MVKNIQVVLDSIGKRILPTLILLSALSVSGSAAFYSVSGLSKLFAGAALEVMIMAGSLEVAKLVTATLLHRYWKTLSNLLKWYLTLAVIVLVLITSMGIYGFLSSAYQDTFRQLTLRDTKIGFVQEKADFYEKDIARFDLELNQIASNISSLSNAKATSIQVRDTTVAGGVRTTVSTAELRLSQSRIASEEANRAVLRAKRQVAADSLQKFQMEVLQLKSDVDVAGELGPLEYLAGLTGVPMDRIINILLLVIVFVFDPLAISLVLASNFAFASIRVPSKKSTQEEVPEVLEPEPKDPLTVDEVTEKYEGAEWLPSVEVEQEDWLESEKEKPDAIMYPELTEEERLKLYQIYGESGSVDVEEEDWKIEEEAPVDFEDSTKNIILEVDPLKEELVKLETYYSREKVGGINPRLEKDLRNQIASLKRRIEEQTNDDDELTKTY